MTGLEGFVLGLVQGLTEFLPVSSSGHLVIGRTVFGLEAESIAFEVAVHGATLLAVLVFFRGRIARLLTGADPAYVAKLAVATIPIVVVALLMRDTVEATFESPLLVSGFLFLTGAALLSLSFRDPEEGSALTEPGWGAALLIGCAQSIAVAPGVSRSGATIVAALWLGVAPHAAVEFSFLLGIPAIAGAIVLQAGAIQAAVGTTPTPFGLGVAAAFGSALLAIVLVFRAVEAERLQKYGVYCWVVAATFAAFLLRGAS